MREQTTYVSSGAWSLPDSAPGSSDMPRENVTPLRAEGAKMASVYQAWAIISSTQPHTPPPHPDMLAAQGVRTNTPQPLRILQKATLATPTPARPPTAAAARWR